MVGRARNMTVRYDPQFLKKLKKLNVRIRKSFKERIILFVHDPNNLELNNHPLTREYTNFRSIDITNDHRALYAEKDEGDETVAYFEEIGIHDELYGKETNGSN